MQSLPLYHKLAGQPVILLGTGEAADAKRRLIERAGGIPVGEENREARLAFVTLVDEADATAAARRLKARGLLVNVTDRPALCDFTVPSLIDRAPVVIAVGTGGASAGLAKALRMRLDALLPAGLGRLANALQDARTVLRARFPDPRLRRQAMDAAMQPGCALDPLREPGDDPVAHWLADPAPGARDCVVHLELASEDPDELTLRTARLLGAADAIVTDGAVPPVILGRARNDAVRLTGPLPDPPPPGLVLVLRSPPRKEADCSDH